MEGYCVKENLWWSAIVALIKLKIQLEDTTLKKKNRKKLFVINSKDKVGDSPFYLYRPPYELVMRIWYYIKVRCVSVFSPLILLDNVLNLWGKVRSLRVKTATGLTKWRSKSFNIFLRKIFCHMTYRQALAEESNKTTVIHVPSHIVSLGPFRVPSQVNMSTSSLSGLAFIP